MTTFCKGHYNYHDPGKQPILAAEQEKKNFQSSSASEFHLYYCFMDTRSELVWSDGRRFDQRIQVWSGEKFLYRAHPHEAFRLCLLGAARPWDEGKKVFRIILLRTPLELERLGPASPLTPYSYSSGQRLIRKQTVLSKDRQIPCHVYTHKKLRSSDRWAFILSQTENISPWPLNLRLG